MAKGSVGSSPEVQGFLPTQDTATPLQRALESLSVNLEDELMRYRRSRSTNGVAQPYSSQLKFRAKKRRQRLNLIQVQARTAAQPERAVTLSPELTAANGLPPTTITTPGAGPDLVMEAAPPTESMMPPPNPHLRQQSMAIPGMATVPNQDPYSANPGALQWRGGAIAPYHQLPDDYLESTEALLDSLPSPYDEVDGYDDVEYSPSLREQLTTPLGIGALLLLLVGSAGFGYAVTSPKTLEFFQENALIQTLWGGDETEEIEPQVEVVEPVEVEPETGLQGIGPDLSEEEFRDLDLDRLSTIEQEEVAPPRLRERVPRGTTPSESAAGSAGSENPGGSASEPSSPVPAAPVESPAAVTNTTVPTPTTITRPQVPATPQPAAAPRPQERAPSSPPAVTPGPQVVPSPQAAPPTPPQPVQQAPAVAPVVPPQPLTTTPVPQPLPQVQTAPPAPLAQPDDRSVPAAVPTAPAPITQPPPLGEN